MSLISKLNEKFKNIKDDTKKRVMATILAGGIALSGLGMAGCNPNSNNPDNTNPPITNPGDENTGNNGGSQNSGNNNGGSQNPNYSKYSQTLQNVLTDSYYTTIIGDAKSTDDDYVYNHPRYQPIPYGFLEDEGFDISKFKTKQLSCTSELYSIGNDLYIELKAEIAASTNYIANYVLKYSLTEQEMSELNKLFSSLYYSTYQYATYFQAPFFVQELSYSKDPEVQSVGYTTAECNNSSVEFFNAREMIGTSHMATYLKSEYVDNSQTVYHYYIVRPKVSESKCNSKMGIVKMHVNGHCEIVVNNRVVQNNSDLKLSGKLTAENRTNFNNSIQSITSYTSRNHYFKDHNNQNALESVFGK